MAEVIPRDVAYFIARKVGPEVTWPINRYKPRFIKPQPLMWWWAMPSQPKKWRGDAKT